MRPRKKDRHLPPCVHLRHGAYYLVKNGKWERLGNELSTALAEYGRRMAEPTGEMGTLIDEALADLKPRVSKNTWTQYRSAGDKLKHMLAAFSPQQVTQRTVVDLRRQLASTPNMANRCLSVLRSIFDYALESGLVDLNPVIGIKRLEEAKRDRLVTLEEFNRIYAKAGDRLQIIMDLLYLTGQRVNDVLGIAMRDLLVEGIAFTQQKTGAKLIVRWTPQLRAVVKRAEELDGNVRKLVKVPTLLRSRYGTAPDYRSVSDQWRRACDAAGVPDTDLRDLRAMSATRARRQGKDASKLLGHKSTQMTQRYLRDREVPEVDGPVFGEADGTTEKTG